MFPSINLQVKMSKCRLPKEEVKATVNLALDVPEQPVATTVSSVDDSAKSVEESGEALETSAIVSPDDLPDQKVTESKSPEPEKESKSDDAAIPRTVSADAVAFTVTKAVALFVGGRDSDDEDEEVTAFLTLGCASLSPARARDHHRFAPQSSKMKQKSMKQRLMRLMLPPRCDVRSHERPWHLTALLKFISTDSAIFVARSSTPPSSI